LIAKGGFASIEVEANYTKARELCERLGDMPQLFPVLWGLARMHDVRGEPKVGRDLGKELLSVADKAQDPALLLQAHHELWANFTELGELTSARTHLEQGFALYDRQKHNQHAFLYGGHDPGVCCRYHAADVLWLLGYPDQALGRSRESLALARELSHASTTATALSFAAWFEQRFGERQAVRARLEEGISLSTERGFLPRQTQASFLQAWLLVEQGHQEAGIAQMSKILSTERVKGVSGRWNMQFAALLADANRQTGQSIEGLKVVTEALARAQQTECSYYEAELHRIQGELLLAHTDADEQQAEICFQNALKVARRQNAKSLELRAAMSMSRLWQRQGKKVEAQNLLAGVYRWFTEGFDTADLKQAKALLEDL
jgi:predicted ATPase